MKFIIHRSRAGFGDRVNQLCLCIEIAIKTNRILVVDWRDNIWAGNDEDKNFFYYFTLKDVPHITHGRFLEISKKIKINGVWPFKWENWENCNLCKKFDEDYMNFLNYQKQMIRNDVKGIDKEILAQCRCLQEELDSFKPGEVIEFLEKKHEDVLLWQDMKCNIPLNSLLFSKIKFNDNVIKFINNDINSYIIRNKIPYIAIHLRGTDRSVVHSLDTEHLYNGSDDTEIYINNIVENIDTSKCKNIMLLTDSIKLKEKFIELYDNKFNIILNSTILLENEESIHVHEENKVINNLHMLKDFNYLIKAVDIYNDGKSYFSNIAKIINNTLKTVKDEKVIDGKIAYNIKCNVNSIFKNANTKLKEEKSTV